MTMLYRLFLCTLSNMNRIMCVCATINLLLTVATDAQWQTTGLSDCGPVTALVSSPPYLFAATFNGVYRSSDAGDTWSKQNTGLINTNCNDLIECNHVLYCAAQGGVFRSSDAGNSWTWTGLKSVFVLSLSMENSLMLAGTRSGVYASSDTSLTWQLYSDGLPGGFINDVIQIDTTAFAATGSGVYMRTPSMSAWVARKSGLSDTNTQVMLAAGPYLLCGARGTVFISSSMGTSWHQLYNHINQNLIYSLCVAQGSILVGGLSVSIADTAAKSWRNTNMPDSDNCSFLVVGDVVYAGNGNRLWKSSVSALMALLQEVSSDESMSAWTLSPNPVRTQLCIHSASELSGEVRLDVVDLHGQIVRQQHITVEGGPAQELRVDVSDLPSGFYLLRVSTGRRHGVMSFVH